MDNDDDMDHSTTKQKRRIVDVDEIDEPVKAKKHAKEKTAAKKDSVSINAIKSMNKPRGRVVEDMDFEPEIPDAPVVPSKVEPAPPPAALDVPKSEKTSTSTYTSMFYARMTN